MRPARWGRAQRGLGARCLYASRSVNKDYESELLSPPTHRPVTHLNGWTIQVCSINKKIYCPKYIQIQTPFKFHHMLNLRSNLPFSISTNSQKANLCTHSCLRPQRINTDYLLLMAMHLYPQLKTHSSFESASGRCHMQSRCTEGNTLHKRDIIAFHSLPKRRAEY